MNLGRPVALLKSTFTIIYWVVSRVLLLTKHVSLFLGRRFFGEDADTIKNSLITLYGWQSTTDATSSDTAWLNGVRGLAAFLVMMHHLNGDWLGIPMSLAPYGAVMVKDKAYDRYSYYPKEHVFYDLWRLPFIRLFFSAGDGMVAIFFILSGFVLSLSPLRLIHARRHEELGPHIASLIFRRWFRLFLPCIAISIVYFLWRLLVGPSKHSSLAQILSETRSFALNMEVWIRPWNVDFFKAIHPHNAAMWTIPYEYNGTLFLGIALLVAGRLEEPFPRMTSITLLSLYAAATGWWHLWLFGNGIVLADYTLTHGSISTLSSSTTRKTNLLWSTLFLISLSLLGWTSSFEEFHVPGPLHNLVSSLLPSAYEIRYITSLGAILFLTSALHLPTIRSLFSTRPLLHLGRISFMLYLLHNLIIYSFGGTLRWILYLIFVPRRFKEEYQERVYVPWDWVSALIWALCTILTVALTLIAGHWGEVWVDRPCLGWVRGMDGWFLRLGNGSGLGAVAEEGRRRELMEANMEMRTVVDAKKRERDVEDGLLAQAGSSGSAIADSSNDMGNSASAVHIHP